MLETIFSISFRLNSEIPTPWPLSLEKKMERRNGNYSEGTNPFVLSDCKLSLRSLCQINQLRLQSDPSL